MNPIVNFDASFSHHVMAPYGRLHNFPRLPVILYEQVLLLGENAENEVKELFEKNGWINAWTNGIFDYPHYHTTAHEVLAVIEGDCLLELGWADGSIQKVLKGDIVVLPAGVVHRNAGSSEDFTVIGAYANGQQCDMNYGNEENREKDEENIKNVPSPGKDPVFGNKGPIIDYWLNENINEPIKEEKEF